MLKRGVLLAILLCIALQTAEGRGKRPRYIFILPYGYIGWVQIIFNDPSTPALPIKDGGFVIDIPESGLTRTSDLRVEDFKSQDEFYYHSSSPAETKELGTVPTDYVLPGVSHGGFDVMDTGGKGKGYSWFVFFGPPSIRSKVPLADWDKVVEDWRKAHGNMRVSSPDPYPTPGRLPATSTQQ